MTDPTPPPAPAPVQEVPDAFRAWLIRGGRSENTAIAYASDIIKFYRWDTVTPDTYADQAADFINDLRSKQTNPSSVLRYMSAIRAYRKFLFSQKIIATEPFVDYKAPKPYSAHAHPLPGGMSDVEAMLDACKKPNHRVLVGLCGLAGLRVSEARSITPRSFTTDHEGYLWLTVHGKGDVYREVPVSDELLALLTEIITVESNPDTPLVGLSDRGARKVISDAGQRANVARKVSSHDLRHTFASDIYNKTKDLRVTQELLGHASSTTTEGYTWVNPAAKRKAIMEVLK